MVEVFLYLLEKGLAVLPGWIAHRLLPPQRVAEQVEIDLRSQNPIVFSIRSQVPNVDLWFRISNLSPINLVLDRFLVDLWVGQPTFRAAVLERRDLPRRSSIEDVYVWHDLSEHQREQIRTNLKDNVVSVRVIIYVSAYFESRVGWVVVKRMLERWNLPVAY